jgi:hypothetical protein
MAIRVDIHQISRALIIVLVCCYGTITPAEEKFLERATASWNANRALLPAFEADLVFESASSNVESRSELRSAAGDLLVITETPGLKVKYHVARSAERLRIIAQQPTDRADPIADLLFNGKYWQGVERSGELLVLRRPDQMAGGQCDPISLQSSSFGKNFPTELAEASVHAKSIESVEIDSHRTWLTLKMKQGSQEWAFVVEFDSFVSLLPTRQWCNVDGSTLSYRTFSYEVLKPTAGKLCMKKEDYSCARTPVLINAQNDPDMDIWARKMTMSLQNIQVRDPKELAPVLEVELAGRRTIDLRDAAPIVEAEADETDDSE